MDAARWSPIWVFVGGCLTGAAVIGVHFGRSDAESSSHARGGDTWSEVAAPSAPERDGVDEHAVDVAARPAEAAVTPVGSPTSTPDREEADAGNSVGDALARLEADYRERIAAAEAKAQAASDAAREEPAPAAPTEPEREAAPQATGRVAAGDKAPAREPGNTEPVAAPGAEAPTVGVTVATVEADAKPATALEEVARILALREEQPKPVDPKQQQMAAQMQQVAAMQQATLSQQYQMMQYLQLLALSRNPQATLVNQQRPRERTRGGRIVASLPPTFSDSDNPWGFEMQPTVLVH
jgi:hypothetical protein